MVPDRATEAAWAADRAVLATAHRDLLAAIRGFPPDRLGRNAGGRKRWTYGDLIIGIAMHDAYHAGQIQMLKRLVGVR